MDYIYPSLVVSRVCTAFLSLSVCVLCLRKKKKNEMCICEVICYYIFTSPSNVCVQAAGQAEFICNLNANSLPVHCLSQFGPDRVIYMCLEVAIVEVCMYVTHQICQSKPTKKKEIR